MPVFDPTVPLWVALLFGVIVAVECRVGWAFGRYLGRWLKKCRML